MEWQRDESPELQKEHLKLLMVLIKEKSPAP